MRSLRATLRLQLHAGFDFADATAQVPYIAALGVSHVYLSPIGAARQGSTHGYDVIDPAIVNPELGGEAALGTLIQALHEHDLGAIVDIVPNHMAADTANPWWNNVLALGRQSAYAHYFDIDWDAPGADGRLCLPWLGQPLEQALDEGSIKLVAQSGGVGAALDLAGARLPLSETSLAWLCERAGIALGEQHDAVAITDAVRRAVADQADALAPAIDAINHNRAALEHCLSLQHYCPVFWRDGDRWLNYRRFFDIHGLAGLRVEREDVFDAVHALPLRLIECGWIDGLRVDHIDGLSEPGHYLRRLRERMQQVAGTRPVTLHVEKILAPGETLPEAWPVDGTTGYDFLREVIDVQASAEGNQKLLAAWREVSGRSGDFSEEELTARRYVLDHSLAVELDRCARAFSLSLPECHATDQYALPQVRAALYEVLQHMPVYRSYLNDGAATTADRGVLAHAFGRADREGDTRNAAIRSALHHCLLQTRADSALRIARSRFEQLSGALNAKAVEDTSFYRHGAWLLRNEVGSSPAADQFGIEAFHQAMRERAARWPLSMLATATHDHKRGEDTRARLAALGETADAFIDQARDWCAQLGSRSQPDGGTQWMILQTVLAAWPLQLSHDDADGLRDYAERLHGWLEKSEREAKLHTSWTEPDQAYETAARQFIDDLLLAPAHASLRQQVHQAARKLDSNGALNSLTAATLRMTAPGVPDLYQGTEFWDQSLVDPDNRRPVDFAARAAALAEPGTPTELLRQFRDGRIKQQLTRVLLLARKAWPQLFTHGDYNVLHTSGARSENLLAFQRNRQQLQLFVLAPRLCADALSEAELPLPAASFWGDTRVAPLIHDEPSTYFDLFTGHTHAADAAGWPVQALLAEWPIAVWVPTIQANDFIKLLR